MGTERTDAELVTAIAAGDRGALRILHERHAPWLLSRLRRRCADDDVAREAVQDTFVAVWRGASRWDGRGEPAAWMWGIAIRRLIGVVRARGRWLPVADAAAATNERIDVPAVVGRIDTTSLPSAAQLLSSSSRCRAPCSWPSHETTSTRYARSATRPPRSPWREP